MTGVGAPTERPPTHPSHDVGTHLAERLAAAGAQLAEASATVGQLLELQDEAIAYLLDLGGHDVGQAAQDACGYTDLTVGLLRLMDLVAAQNLGGPVSGLPPGKCPGYGKAICDGPSCPLRGGR